MKYFFAFLATLGLIIIVVILLISGGGNGSKKSDKPNSKKSLQEYSTTDAQASILVDGKINSESEHDQIRITVNKDNVTYQQMSGYEGNVVASNTFANNQTAYSAFLSALKVAGFTKSNKDTTSSAGQCPLGQRYTVKFVSENKDLVNSWFSSCGHQGNFAGNPSLTRDLFELQVPGFNDLTQGIEF